MASELEIIRSNIDGLKAAIAEHQQELVHWEAIYKIKTQGKSDSKPTAEKKSSYAPVLELIQNAGMKQRIIEAIKNSPEGFLSTKAIIDAVKIYFKDKTEIQLRGRIAPILSENKYKEQTGKGLFITRDNATNRKAGYEWGLAEKAKAA